jgi:hypothetical protein
VLDWIAKVAAWHLDYLIEADVVELASLLLVDPVDYHNELAVAAPPAVLLALYPSTTIFSLIREFSMSFELVFAEDCTDDLLTRGVACHEVK